MRHLLAEAARAVLVAALLRIAAVAALAALVASLGCSGSADVVYDADGNPLAVRIRGELHGVGAQPAIATPDAPAPAAPQPAPEPNPPAGTLRAWGPDFEVAPLESGTPAGGPFFVALRAAWAAALAGAWAAARAHAVAATRCAAPQILPGAAPAAPQTRPARERAAVRERPAVRGVLDNGRAALDELDREVE